VEKLEKNVNTVPFLYPPIEAEVKSMFNSWEVLTHIQSAIVCC
jgi:hypothetical protein